MIIARKRSYEPEEQRGWIFQPKLNSQAFDDNQTAWDVMERANDILTKWEQEPEAVKLDLSRHKRNSGGRSRRLPQEVVKHIRDMYRDGMRLSEISKILKVHYSTVFKIAHREDNDEKDQAVEQQGNCACG